VIDYKQELKAKMASLNSEKEKSIHLKIEIERLESIIEHMDNMSVMDFIMFKLRRLK